MVISTTAPSVTPPPGRRSGSHPPRIPPRINKPTGRRTLDSIFVLVSNRVVMILREWSELFTRIREGTRATLPLWALGISETDVAMPPAEAAAQTRRRERRSERVE
ncbi:hypothetical protein GWI33_002864 [Rhynchophorus ferrugineus]|uniref:Uncharacterized protein n=1 Tax=Rhynchophorus ferrugineus TaxID=354439 RepID=A0A834IM08_RHYFE|nr:hypothetical protein GWI33_002864 [Rhynchophorus ferrugineus]